MKTKVSISKDKPTDCNIESILDAQLVELAEIRNPGANEKELDAAILELQAAIQPVYVTYHQFSRTIECVPELEFYELKTNRNQMLISMEEQQQLRKMHISIAGMSIGSTILYGLVGSGFGCSFTISDDDAFSTSNLNRVQATLLDVGKKKVEVAMVRAMMMDPFLEIDACEERIGQGNIDRFFAYGKSDVVFDEVDDYKMKVLVREHAKLTKVPVIMLTNLGDSVMIDVERYDLDTNLDIFNGQVDQRIIDEIKVGETSVDLMKKFSLSLVDSRLIPKRAVETLELIGKDLVGRPQLYGTVSAGGALAPLVTRLLKNRGDLDSGRYYLKLDSFSLVDKLT